MKNLQLAAKNPHFIFIKGDLLDNGLASRALGDCDLIFHLAADPEVRAGAENPGISPHVLYTQNI